MVSKKIRVNFVTSRAVIYRYAGAVKSYIFPYFSFFPLAQGDPTDRYSNGKLYLSLDSGTNPYLMALPSEKKTSFWDI